MESVKHRTQISLEDWQYQTLLEISRKKKKSLSAIIRELLSEKLSAQATRKEADPISELMGIGSGDGLPVAREHDKYLYGKKK
ncbi:MAG: ribbon-helix-helix domain-containing protein [Nitrospirae bacterium]|nr:ribbon-helix-helix domain-containing protein [Nitrospirota bacterium]MCL5237912.1 ribbon-helix-helix domain-containing protein [Nitrospirota bacterium]